MLRRLAIPFVSRAGHRLSSTMIPDEHLDKFDPENPNYTKFEVVNDPDIWSYVERLMPVSKIATPPTEAGPSGWQPVRLTREEARKLPYFVPRNRNHLLPVYEKVDIRGPRYTTIVRHVQGDPWALRNEVKAHLERTVDSREILTKVNELTQSVSVKGRLVGQVKAFLMSKGF